MHIADGFLPAEVCIGGYVTAAALTGYALRKINQQPNPQEGIPKAALLAAAFFVVSWIHIPIPPTSVHLVLNGLLGVLLGYYAIPALLVGLFFQAVMFQHGGLTTLGVNLTMMGLPALLSHFLFRLGYRVGRTHHIIPAVLGFLAGGLGIGISTLIFWVVLITNIPASVDASIEQAAIVTTVVAHIPVMILEGGFTALVVVFLLRVRPDMLGIPTPPLPQVEYELQH